MRYEHEYRSDLCSNDIHTNQCYPIDLRSFFDSNMSKSSREWWIKEGAEICQRWISDLLLRGWENIQLNMLEKNIMKYINERKRHVHSLNWYAFRCARCYCCLLALLVSNFYLQCLGKETGVVDQQVTSDISDDGKPQYYAKMRLDFLNVGKVYNEVH